MKGWSSQVVTSTRSSHSRPRGPGIDTTRPCGQGGSLREEPGRAAPNEGPHKGKREAASGNRQSAPGAAPRCDQRGSAGLAEVVEVSPRKGLMVPCRRVASAAAAAGDPPRGRAGGEPGSTVHPPGAGTHPPREPGGWPHRPHEPSSSGAGPPVLGPRRGTRLGPPRLRGARGSARRLGAGCHLRRTNRAGG
jgi:hypothetical protein